MSERTKFGYAPRDPFIGTTKITKEDIVQDFRSPADALPTTPTQPSSHEGIAMSDAIDDFRALKDFRKRLREKFGTPCDRCLRELPKAQPTILIPQQVCRRHRPNYRDPRPEVTQKEIDTL